MQHQQRLAHVVALVGIGACALALPVLAQECPELIGQWPHDPARLVTGAGSYAYVNHDSVLMVVDISDPAAPLVRGELNLGGGWLDDMTAANGFVFVVSGTMKVIDVSDPAVPHVEGTLDSPTVSCVAVSGQYAYLGGSSEVRGLRVIDVSSPSAPIQVGSVDVLPPNASPHDVAVSGQYAYLLWLDEFGTPAVGLTIIDVSTPSAPFETGWVAIPGESAEGIAVYRGYAYIGNDDLGVRIVDVADPTAPVVVGVVDTPGVAGYTSISLGYAWVADYNGGVRVMDLKDPVAPVEIGFYDEPENLIDVNVQGKVAVAADLQAGLLVFKTCEIPVFPDGFDSGDTSAWSATVP